MTGGFATRNYKRRVRVKKMREKALQEAFAGESMAQMRYLAFSEIA